MAAECVNQAGPFLSSKIKNIFWGETRTSPGGEGATSSPHSTPIGAFGASILAPTALDSIRYVKNKYYVLLTFGQKCTLAASLRHVEYVSRVLLTLEKDGTDRQTQARRMHYAYR